jgi:hypothetical protein
MRRGCCERSQHVATGVCRCHGSARQACAVADGMYPDERVIGSVAQFMLYNCPTDIMLVP